MFKTFTMQLAGRPLTIETGKMALLANGAVLVRYGDTVVISTATASKAPRDGIDFFPLSVDYEEKLYSVGKIPGGFIKREGKPSEKAILTSRLIDRPIRPLFPKGFRNDVQVVATVLSVDQDLTPEMTAMVETIINSFVAEDQWILNAIMERNLKIGLSLDNFDKVTGNTKKFEVALAHNLDKVKNVNPCDGTYFASRKLDGCRTICKINNYMKIYDYNGKK